jgi:Uma2 family endonuclease
MNRVPMPATPSKSPPRTFAELLERLGGVSPARIHMDPLPGTATVEDVVAKEVHEDRLCELVDGVLVEKPVGFYESALALFLGARLHVFVDRRNLGVVTGEQGMMQIFPGLVRIPDVAFAAWSRFRNGRIPDEPVPLLVPDLVVEVLSRGDKPGEIKRKLREYFDAGVRLVWLVNPRKRTVSVYTSFESVTVLSERSTLTGGDVLPGFKLPLERLFRKLDRWAGGIAAKPKAPRKKRP